MESNTLLRRPEQLDDGLVAIPSGPRQRRPAVCVILRIDIDLARGEQQLDDGLVALLSGP